MKNNIQIKFRAWDKILKMNKELQKSNAINLNLPTNEMGDLYCVDCENKFDYKDLYHLGLEGECICHECDTIRYDKQNRISRAF